MPGPWFKILHDGVSPWGHPRTWKLPERIGKSWTPGGWLELRASVPLCLTIRGFHLTDAPLTYFVASGCPPQHGWEVFLAEYEGEIAGPAPNEMGPGSVIACRKARMVRPATDDELNELGLRRTHRPFYDVEGTLQDPWGLVPLDAALSPLGDACNL